MRARRRYGSLVSVVSVSVAASAGTAPAIEPSSLMARAASVAIAASASLRKRATPACFMRPRATTAAERTAGFACVDSASSALASPIAASAMAPTCWMYMSWPSLSASMSTTAAPPGL